MLRIAGLGRFAAFENGVAGRYNGQLVRHLLCHEHAGPALTEACPKLRQPALRCPTTWEGDGGLGRLATCAFFPPTIDLHFQPRHFAKGFRHAVSLCSSMVLDRRFLRQSLGSLVARTWSSISAIGRNSGAPRSARRTTPTRRWSPRRGRWSIISTALDFDFNTSVRVVVDDAEKITDQKMAGPRLPIVETQLDAANLSIRGRGVLPRRSRSRNLRRSRSRGFAWAWLGSRPD